jgi:hypothetical protein
MKDADFSEMSEDGLRALIRAAEQEIKRRREVKRELALVAAQEAGMTPEELLSMAPAGGFRRSGTENLGKSRPRMVAASDR